MAYSTPRQFTSNPSKFLKHPDQLMSYRMGTGRTVISTHVSLTGACNLSCSYCSFRNRDKAQSLDYETLTRYVDTLTGRGLRAVTLTGGGEPLLYSKINEFVRLCYGKGLYVGLITNGFKWKRFTEWDKLAWTRVSVNDVPGWSDEINVPEMGGTVGISVIYQGHNEGDVRDVLSLADKINASYVRIFPEYTIPEEERAAQYREIEELLTDIEDPRLNVLYNMQRAPRCRSCHLSYFRPFLAEDGMVYQCCVSMFADGAFRLPERHRLCRAEDVADFLSGRVPVKVIPMLECGHCTYADIVENLDCWSAAYAGPHDMFV